MSANTSEPTTVISTAIETVTTDIGDNTSSKTEPMAGVESTITFTTIVTTTVDGGETTPSPEATSIQPSTTSSVTTADDPGTTDPAFGSTAQTIEGTMTTSSETTTVMDDSTATGKVPTTVDANIMDSNSTAEITTAALPVTTVENGDVNSGQGTNGTDSDTIISTVTLASETSPSVEMSSSSTIMEQSFNTSEATNSSSMAETTMITPVSMEVANNHTESFESSTIGVNTSSISTEVTTSDTQSTDSGTVEETTSMAETVTSNTEAVTSDTQSETSTVTSDNVASSSTEADSTSTSQQVTTSSTEAEPSSTASSTVASSSTTKTDVEPPTTKPVSSSLSTSKTTTSAFVSTGEVTTKDHGLGTTEPSIGQTTTGTSTGVSGAVIGAAVASVIVLVVIVVVVIVCCLKYRKRAATKAKLKELNQDNVESDLVFTRPDNNSQFTKTDNAPKNYFNQSTNGWDTTGIPGVDNPMYSNAQSDEPDDGGAKVQGVNEDPDTGGSSNNVERRAHNNDPMKRALQAESRYSVGLLDMGAPDMSASSAYGKMYGKPSTFGKSTEPTPEEEDAASKGDTKMTFEKVEEPGPPDSNDETGKLVIGTGDPDTEVPEMSENDILLEEKEVGSTPDEKTTEL